MVEAGKSSSQTGELPSSGPFTVGTPIPDAPLRPENPPIIDPISGLIPMEPVSRRIASMSDSDLDEIERDLATINIGSDTVKLKLPHSSRGTSIGAGLAAGIVGFTGTAIVDNLNPQATQAAIIRPVDEYSASTKADNRKLVTGGDGGTICTPEFLAAHPNAIAQGDSNVGGEPSSNTSSTTAEISGSDTAAIDNVEQGQENVLVTFTNEKGEVLEISIKPCNPPKEEDICEDPQVIKFFKDFPQFADYDGISGNDEQVDVYYRNPDGTFKIIKIDPCPPVVGPEANWNYETVDDAEEAWIDGKIKIDYSRKFKSDLTDEPMPLNTPNHQRKPDHRENPYHIYNGIFLGAKIIDGQVVISLGHEGKVNSKVVRFTSAYRIGSGLNGIAELTKGSEGLEIPNLGKNKSTAKDVFKRLKDKGGMPLYVVTEGTPKEGYPKDIERAIKQQRQEEYAFFDFMWSIRDGKTNLNKAPDCVNADFDSVDPRKLPMALFTFSKDAI